MLLRFVDSREQRAQADMAFKIRQAFAYDHNGQQSWIVELTVGRRAREVDGCVFIDHTFTELRFERYDAMAPPGFLSGRYLRQNIDESSLSLLYDDPTDEDIRALEASIRLFVEKCSFCVRTLTDTATSIRYHSAMAYRYKSARILIRKED